MKIQDNGPTVQIDGVGLVNGQGKVILFVEVEVANFTHYTVRGSRIVISGRGAEDHERTYGPIVLRAVADCRSIQVCQSAESGDLLDIATVSHRPTT